MRRAALLDGPNPAPGTVVLHGPGGLGKATLLGSIASAVGVTLVMRLVF